MSVDPTREWLEKHGVAESYDRLFNEGEDIPSSHLRLVRGLLQRGLDPADAETTYGSLMMAATEAQESIRRVADIPARGQPRRPFSEKQLITGFEIFPPATSGPAAHSAVGPSAPFASSASASSATTASTSAAMDAFYAKVAGVDPSREYAELEPEPEALTRLSLYPYQLEALNREILIPAWERLRRMQWPGWAHDEGNPFVVKISKQNAKSLGVPAYFSVITHPMDLTRMREKAESKLSKRALEEMKPATCYSSAHEFLRDCALIIQNAKTYNCPPAARAALSEGRGFPNASGIPADQLTAFPVYRMACDFEQVVKKLAGGLTHQWAVAERAYKHALHAEILAVYEKQKATRGGAS